MSKLKQSLVFSALTMSLLLIPKTLDKSTQISNSLMSKNRAFLTRLLEQDTIVHLPKPMLCNMGWSSYGFKSSSVSKKDALSHPRYFEFFSEISKLTLNIKKSNGADLDALYNRYNILCSNLAESYILNEYFRSDIALLTRNLFLLSCGRANRE
jgi:hypothetical protein